MSSEGSLNKYDLEKDGQAQTHATAVNVVEADDGVNRTTGVFGKLWKVVLWANSFGVEVRGVERVREDERDHNQSLYDSGFLWMSANMTLSTFSLGTLANSIWQMQLVDAALTIVFFNLLCTLPVALFSTWGKTTGLRQMMLGRYSFGTIGIFIPVALNCLACLGWSTINSIVGAQALHAVSDTHQLPIWAGILVIALITLVVALFGYRWVHHFERYASIPVSIIFIIVLVQVARQASSSMSPPGEATAASVLSFGATCVGFGLGWSSLAADYTVNLPAEASTVKVFFCTYLGLNTPLIFLEILGAAAMSTFVNKSTWETAQMNGSVGGLLGAILRGPMGGFGQFCLVILALSIVANNIPNMYSFALSFQAFGKYAMAIPRLFLVIVGTAIYIVLSIVGENSFEEVLDHLLLVLAYWLCIYTAILLEEHYIFRGGSFKNYNLEGYNDPSVLPRGFAAMGAICFGAAGAVLGMSQVWYVGKLASLIGDPAYGADIGFELSGAFAAVSYPGLRYLERKYTKR